MRSKRACFVSPCAILTKEEIKQMKEERAAAVKPVPGIGDVQRSSLAPSCWSPTIPDSSTAPRRFAGSGTHRNRAFHQRRTYPRTTRVDPTGRLSCDTTQRDELEWRGYAGAIGSL
jgi:hypothetical protein